MYPTYQKLGKYMDVEFVPYGTLINNKKETAGALSANMDLMNVTVTSNNHVY